VFGDSAALSDSELRSLLLYVIARDNEVEHVLSLLSDSQTLALAAFAVSEGEPDAKWQLSVRLGQLEPAIETEEVLLQFASDANEYVRRRTIMTMADLGLKSTEPHAWAAWNSGDQYQRMAALHVLQRLQSGQLGHFIELALADGREHLVTMAKNMNVSRNG
jgi:HEAT repeat protein